MLEQEPNTTLIAGPGQPRAAGADPNAAQKPEADAQAKALATAKQALDQAQGRVDADKRAHSPGCVAVDQKGVDKATADLAHAQTTANAATQDAPGGSASGRVLSVTA